MYKREVYKKNDKKLPELLQAVVAVSAYRALFSFSRGLYFTTSNRKLCLLGNFRIYLCHYWQRSIRSRRLFDNEKGLFPVTSITDETYLYSSERGHQQTSLGCYVEEKICRSTGPAGYVT